LVAKCLDIRASSDALSFIDASSGTDNRLHDFQSYRI
jgi:hypothetical protein